MTRKQSSRPRAALYARTSRAGQHIDVQVAQLRQVAEQRGWEIVDEFIDDEVSSRKKSRRQFEAMRKAARTGRVNLVAAVALDRFARSVRELLDLSENLKSWNVDLVSLREQVETSTPVGKMTFTVLSAVAELERSLIRERTLAGLEQARRRGKTLGRPRADVDGWDVRALRQRGLAWRDVSQKLGVSESTARRALRDLSKSSQRKMPNPSANCPT